MIEVAYSVREHPMHEELTDKQPITFSALRGALDFVEHLAVEYKHTAWEATLRYPAEFKDTLAEGA